MRIAFFVFDGAEELDWVGPWEVLAAWAKGWPEDNVDTFTVAQTEGAVTCATSVEGVDDPGAGGLADPIVLHNKDTDGYIAIVNQAWGNNFIDRGAACTELIKNWLSTEQGLLAVEPAGKLSTTWGEVKAARY